MRKGKGEDRDSAIKKAVNSRKPWQETGINGRTGDAQQTQALRIFKKQKWASIIRPLPMRFACLEKGGRHGQLICNRLKYAMRFFVLIVTFYGGNCIMKKMGMLALAMVFVLCAFCSANAEELPYEEGSVFVMTFVRTEANKRDTYLRNLIGGWKKHMEEAKKEGRVLSYKVLGSMPANKEDWNVALMVEYKNMAALDGLGEKNRQTQARRSVTEEERLALIAKQAEVRELLGSKLVRELILK